MTTPDLHAAVLDALAAEQQQLIFVAQLPWTAAGNQIIGFIGDQIMAETWRWSSRYTDAEFIAATANRAQQMLDLRREIAKQHAPKQDDPFSLITYTYCSGCAYTVRRAADGEASIGPTNWPCTTYLAVARATLPADVLARYPELTA